MELSFGYMKLRKQFGKQCLFQADYPKLIEDLKTDKSLGDKYIFKNPVHKGVQVGYVRSENSVNTPIKDYNDRGMNHIEGGWPKEIDTNDDEAVIRFRKKVERLDNYIAAMQRLTKPMEHAILQNNAVNIYEKYFEESASVFNSGGETCRIQSKYRDPHKPGRPITHCSWSPEGDSFAVSHASTQFQSNRDTRLDAYVWDLEKPLTPEATLMGDTPILSLEYNSKDFNWLAGGLMSGQVAHFDLRRGQKPVAVSPMTESHRDPTHSVLWINSKSGAEFFSASSDGAIKWWDCRKLDQPIDEIILDMSRGDKPNINKAYLASCLEYESSIPVKYTVGTETGHIISGNRKGTSHQEKLPWMLKSDAGPIYSIHRNQGFLKNFLAIGCWSVKIWSEDCKDSPIIWTKNYTTKLTCGAWSGGRLSLFFVSREDGILDLWDILMDQKNPILSLNICSDPLTTLRAKEDGVMLLTGNSTGTAYLVRFPSNLTESLKNEKVFLSAMFDRESHREKLLEGRNREIKLRLRELMLAKEAMLDEHEERPKTELEIQTENYKEALENDYLKEIENTLTELEKKREAAKQVEKTA